MKKKIEISPPVSIGERNVNIRAWINIHDLLNLKALCDRIDFDRSNFTRFLEGYRDLSELHIDRLENVLRGYGYAVR